ncbi:MAG: prepilin-type N-terminal cleavage/methylation domain-containing protein [Candidatus Paceibacterota bacterium]|jgi:Tfp pilus assembly protein PilW
MKKIRGNPGTETSACARKAVRGLRPSRSSSTGYTLIELIIATGLFSLIMLLASGAYLMMIGLQRQAQGIATGIDNLSFAIETMTRDIRTGTAYTCPGGTSNCTIDGSGIGFSFTDSDGSPVTYALSSNSITQNGNALTDPSVDITALTFYVSGTSKSDNAQPHVTITISGKVLYGQGKSETFHIETGATMRGSDL